MKALRIRYVDGSGVMPHGVQVVVVEGLQEVVIQMDFAACPTLLADAMTETMTEWAHERFMYVGPGEVQEYRYELAHLPGEWARVVIEPGRCRVLMDPTAPSDVVLAALTEKVTAAVRKCWLWVGESEVLAS